MDRLRGLAVLLVVVWHAFSIPTFYGYTMPHAAEVVNDALSPYRIPALLVLSGLLLTRSLRKPLDVYYWGKAANIVWPLLVWSAIYLFANPGVDGGTIGYWVGGSYLWYLGAVAFCYLIGPIVRWVPPLTVAAVLIGLLFLLRSSDPVVVQVLEHAPYFFIGVAAQPISGRLLRAHGWVVVCCAVIAVGWGVYSTMAYGYAPRIHLIGLPVSLIGIFCLAWALNKVRSARLLEWVGRHSLQFYVCHFPVMVLACRFGALELPTLATYTVLFGLGVGTATPLAVYLGRSLLFRLPPLPRWREESGGGGDASTAVPRSS